MSKVNVKNNHDTTLNVAGTDARPGATVAVDQKAFDRWQRGHAARIWLEKKLIEVTTSKAAKDTVSDDRRGLEARAGELNVSFSNTTSDKDLEAAVKEAEKQAAENDREALLAQARELGLNPNANTGIQKLQAMIAEKQAA